MLPYYRYTFVDLAQIVCKVPETLPEVHSSTEDEDLGGYASEPSTITRVTIMKILDI